MRCASDAAALIVTKCVTVLMPILITHKNGDGMEGGYACVLVCVRACVSRSCAVYQPLAYPPGQKGGRTSAKGNTSMREREINKAVVLCWSNAGKYWFYI